MKLADVKKRTIRELTIYGGLLVVFGGFMSYAIAQENDLLERQKKLEKDSFSMKTKIISSKDEYESAVAAFAIIKRIDKQRLPTNDGLSDTAARIRAARPIIERFRSEYKIGNPEVTFSTVQADDKNTFGLKTLQVYENVMTIKFNSTSDELCLSFIDALIANFPGYLSIKSLNMSRVEDITPKVLTDIRKGAAVTLVNADVEMTWRTLKDIVPAEEAGTNNDSQKSSSTTGKKKS